MSAKSNKLPRSSAGKLLTMNQPKTNPQSPSVSAYPDKTTGSETASTVRKAANRWSEQNRSDLFEQGMRIIYGGTRSKEKVRS